MNFTDIELIELMHKAGIRPSVQRIAILSSVFNTRRHPSAEDIFSELSPHYPSLSRTTVYNSLHALCECGLVRQLEIDGANMRYDMALQKPHSHFICRRCGRIFDMAMPEGLSASAGSYEGFCVDCVDVYFKGICPDCKQK